MNIFGRIFPKRPKPGMDDLSNLLRLARMVQAIERCMALAHIHDEKFVAVLEIPPVNSPQTAVKVAIVAEIKKSKGKQRNETEAS